MRFGRMLVISKSCNDHYGQAAWECQCDCGNKSIVRGQKLRSGHTQSCGCLGSEHRKNSSTTHGHAPKRSVSPTYRTWASMMSRCHNANDTGYRYYGGRGIIVCQKWHNFSNFLLDMGEKPKDHSIDRFPDNNGNYEPGNCRWATTKQQSENKSNTLRVNVAGEIMCLSEAARITGIKYDTLRSRIFRNHWDQIRAMTSK
jgi:hypothetical protein